MTDQEVVIAAEKLGIVLPDYGRSSQVVAPPGGGGGFWAGAPSAAVGADGDFYLAYRLRRPIGEGRGYANVIARSEDGENFTEISTLKREDFDCDSLERPALVQLPSGGWRIYVSCATVGTKHWRIDAIDASSPDQFDPAKRRNVLAGSDTEGLKDPVVIFDGDTWHMWVCAHPLEESGEEDRMATHYATSEDGLDWKVQGVALAPRSGTWDSRGARVAAVVVNDGSVAAYYDGRASSEQNAEEQTGIASGKEPGSLKSVGGPITGSPFGRGSLRYISVVRQGDGYRLYYETTLRNGAHDLRTEYVPLPLSASQS